MSSNLEMAEHVRYMRLCSIKSQLRLESIGLKSSGGALRPRLAKEFGLSRFMVYELWINHFQQLIDQAVAMKEIGLDWVADMSEHDLNMLLGGLPPNAKIISIDWEVMVKAGGKTVFKFFQNNLNGWTAYSVPGMLEVTS